MNSTEEQNTQKSNLVPIKTRFSAGAMAVIETLADENNLSKAEIIRLAVDKHLASYLGDIKFIDVADGKEIKETLIQLLTTMTEMKNELNRIGVNYNQELRLKNIRQKYNDSKKSYDDIKERVEEEDKVMKECSPRNLDHLEKIVNEYDEATRRVCEILCRILV